MCYITQHLSRRFRDIFNASGTKNLDNFEERHVRALRISIPELLSPGSDICIARASPSADTKIVTATIFHAPLPNHNNDRKQIRSGTRLQQSPSHFSVSDSQPQTRPSALPSSRQGYSIAGSDRPCINSASCFDQSLPREMTCNLCDTLSIRKDIRRRHTSIVPSYTSSSPDLDKRCRGERELGSLCRLNALSTCLANEIFY